jgi:hypothetical protein
MPIPSFDSNSVLPPHLGDPKQRHELSPYPCSCSELCDRFGTTPERVAILQGFIRLRAELRKHGMIDAFQWINGSFLEEIETTEGRPPKDIDVVTFYWSPDPAFTRKLLAAFPDLANNATIKANFHTDHFPVDAGFHPQTTVELTRYWTGLFSHTRNNVWKGMLKIDLNTQADDVAAEALLATRA